MNYLLLTELMEKMLSVNGRHLLSEERVELFVENCLNESDRECLEEALKSLPLDKNDWYNFYSHSYEKSIRFLDVVRKFRRNLDKITSDMNYLTLGGGTC